MFFLHAFKRKKAHNLFASKLNKNMKKKVKNMTLRKSNGIDT